MPHFATARYLGIEIEDALRRCPNGLKPARASRIVIVLTVAIREARAGFSKREERRCHRAFRFCAPLLLGEVVVCLLDHVVDSGLHVFSRQVIVAAMSRH